MKGYRHLLFALALPFSVAACSSHSPAIVAHRGGTSDAPENTLPAISKSLENGVDAVWITLQLSKDDVPILYRPTDLKNLTDQQGAVSTYTAAQLATVDAGWSFGKDGQHPYRGKGIGIPRLDTVLKAFPTTTFYLDIKSPDADPAKFTNALLSTLQSTHSLQRTRVYSTDQKYLDALPPVIQRFQSRDETRTLLANVTMAHQCEITPNRADIRWYGLEMKRQVEVVEKYTLGEGRSSAWLVWDKASMECFRSQNKAYIILFGINTLQDYQQAKTLGPDAVMVNSPALFKKIRNDKSLNL